MSPHLYIHEVFPSFQGEGILAGAPQVFIRLSGCNLSCSYCDTPGTRQRVEICTVYDWGGRREDHANPLEIAHAAQIVSSLWEPAMHSVSLTGGEPLLQARELTHLLPLLKQGGMPVYLETNGTLPDAFELVSPWIDHVAMDVKLPSSVGGEDLMDTHRKFLRRSLRGDVFLKVVVDANTRGEELESACRVLGELARGTTLILQPATMPRGVKGISAREAFALYRIASGFFSDVRVIPQAHRAWGIR